MPQYLVTEPLKHNGQSYGPGSDQDTVEMEAKAARELLKLGVLVLAPKTAAAQPKSQGKPKPEEKPKDEAKSAEKGGDGNETDGGGE